MTRLISLTPSFFFFTYTATSEIYTLSLHDALPIWYRLARSFASARLMMSMSGAGMPCAFSIGGTGESRMLTDRKSTRLNSSHVSISYAVFCLKKKKQNTEGVRIYMYGVTLARDDSP